MHRFFRALFRKHSLPWKTQQTIERFDRSPRLSSIEASWKSQLVRSPACVFQQIEAPPGRYQMAFGNLQETRTNRNVWNRSSAPCQRIRITQSGQ
jgi:hypothetical protein